MKEGTQNGRAAVVLAAGALFNLSIGVLYAWSVFKAKITAPPDEGGWAWTSSQAGLPYTVAIAFFAIGSLVGGRIQDKAGPRWVATAGGCFVGLGLVLSGILGDNAAGIALSFGMVTGLGIGLGYGSVTPPALKWFHPCRKGFVSAMTIGGFGLAAVYYAPLANALLARFGIERTFVCLGLVVMAVSALVAQFIENPPSGFQPVYKISNEKKRKKPSFPKEGVVMGDLTWKEMVKTKKFWLMFAIYLFAASMGLMVIGNITRIAGVQAGVLDTAALAGLVSFMAVMNTAGRVGGGVLSDRIGRVNALFAVFALQMCNMAGFAFYRNIYLLIAGIVGTGLCFGALLSIFPVLTADQFGIANYGANYGIVYLAWGLSGVVAPLMADRIYDVYGNFNAAYGVCAAIMVGVIVLNILLRRQLYSSTSLASPQTRSKW